MSTVVRGAELIQKVLGQRLQNLTRYVLGLGWSNDQTGHGITDLTFESMTLTVRPGANEDFIVVEEGPTHYEHLDAIHWSKVDLSQMIGFLPFASRRLMYVDCYTDGIEDIALVFCFEGADQFSIVLDDTDLLLTKTFNPSKETSCGVLPQLRARIARD